MSVFSSYCQKCYRKSIDNEKSVSEKEKLKEENNKMREIMKKKGGVLVMATAEQVAFVDELGRQNKKLRGALEEIENVVRLRPTKEDKCNCPLGSGKRVTKCRHCIAEIAKKALGNRGSADGIGATVKSILPASPRQELSVVSDNHAPKNKEGK